MARIPPPPETLDRPLRALIFDSYYDAYKVGRQPLLASYVHERTSKWARNC